MAKTKQKRNKTRNVSRSRKSKKTGKCRKRFEQEKSKSSKNGNFPDNKNRNQNNVVVEKTKLICRRYQEFHNHFLNYDQILQFLGAIQRNYAGSVDVMDIGVSGQGKPILMVIITNPQSTVDPKYATFINAGLKGSDTFAISNAIYMIYFLTKNPNHLKLMNYLIIPCCNPDAYDEFIKNKVKSETCPGLKRCLSTMDMTNKKQRLQCSDNKKTNLQSNSSNKINSEDLYNKTRNSYRSSSDKGATDSKANKKKTGSEDTSKNSSVAKANKVRDKVPHENNMKPNCQITNDSKGENEIKMDLSSNFPVVLGLDDMRKIPTKLFIEKIEHWKENYVNTSPETIALTRAINSSQFATKLLISLEDGGESICYPYGFSPAITEETDDLKEVAKKGKNAIIGRNFQFGSIYTIQGLTYGNLIDFLKVDRTSIKYTYLIQVYKKKAKYNEKVELTQLMTYGCQIMECVKRMSTAVFKSFTNMTGNKRVETASTKKGIDKKCV